MAQVTRADDILLPMVRELGIQSYTQVPSILTKNIQPVYTVNRRYADIIKEESSTATGSTTIYTVPSGFDFMLCGVALFYTCDAASDATDIDINIRDMDRIMYQPVQAGVALNLNATREFAIPIKVPADTVIEVRGNKTVGNFRKVGVVHGYLVPNA